MTKRSTSILTFKGVVEFRYLSRRPIYRLSQPRQNDFKNFCDRFSVLALCDACVSRVQKRIIEVSREVMWKRIDFRPSQLAQVFIGRILADERKEIVSLHARLLLPFLKLQAQKA